MCSPAVSDVQAGMECDVGATGFGGRSGDSGCIECGHIQTIRLATEFNRRCAWRPSLLDDLERPRSCGDGPSIDAVEGPNCELTSNVLQRISLPARHDSHICSEVDVRY